jgi:hypothetical protein
VGIGKFEGAEEQQQRQEVEEKFHRGRIRVKV